MRHIYRDPSEELHRRVLEDLGGAAGPLPALPPAASLLQLRGQAPGHLTIFLYTTSFTTQMLSLLTIVLNIMFMCNHFDNIATAQVGEALRCAYTILLVSPRRYVI